MIPENHFELALVPADAYYEWQTAPDGKHPYAAARRDGVPMMFAWIWDIWRCEAGAVLRTFAILTTSANATARPIHDRMPVIVEPDGLPLWLGEVKGDAKTLLHPAGDVLRCRPVSRRVNSSANNDADLLSEMG